MPAAGQGLYGVRPHPDAAHLFAKKGQFICTYATQKHQITAQLARTSQSRYMWSTNATNRHNRKALYFDAANAPHYGKYLNDMWTTHGSNCELKWDPATGRVEVYALRDILLNEELGTDYGAPSGTRPITDSPTGHKPTKSKRTIAGPPSHGMPSTAATLDPFPR